MNRPKILHVNGVMFWTIRTRNPDTQVLKDADSLPTVAVRKNGAATGDSVTVTKRSATTGIYDCSYNPAGEVEGDEFTIEETVTVTGTTTSQATYSASWEFTVIAVERGADSLPATAPAGWINAAAIAANALDGKGNWATAGAAMTLTPGERSAVAAACDLALINAADGANLIGALADAIADDWVAGDASPLAIVAAIKADAALSTMISRIDVATSSRLAATSYTAPDNAGIAAVKVVADRINTGLVADGLVWQFTANMLELSPAATGAGDASQATLEEVQTAVESIAATLAGASSIETTGRIAEGGTVTAYIGDDFRVRSGTQLEIPVADVAGALYTKLNTIGAANLNFAASRPDKGPGEITGTVASLSQTSATLFKIVVEITNCGSGLLPDDYVYQIEQRQTQGSEIDSFVEIEGTLVLKAKS